MARTTTMGMGRSDSSEEVSLARFQSHQRWIRTLRSDGEAEGAPNFRAAAVFGELPPEEPPEEPPLWSEGALGAHSDMPPLLHRQRAHCCAARYSCDWPPLVHRQHGFRAAVEGGR